jgi:hypothetical protein
MNYEEALDRVLAEIRETLIAKHHDYGVDNLLEDSEYGIAIRAKDKINRVKTILTREYKVKNETREDSWKDLVGYGIQAILLGRGVLTSEDEISEKPHA